MKVSEIFIYPVKSLGGIQLEHSLIQKRGLQFDRRFMLVDENGGFLTQRDFPQMAAIDIKLKENNFAASANNFGNLTFPKEISEGEKIDVRVWQSVCSAIVADEKINKWFSEVLQLNCKLVFMPDETEREINQKFNSGNDFVSFADGYPVLLIGENSLENLNEKLETKLPMNRFRPNIVIENAEAFAEDKWKKIRGGETVFRSTKPCARCVVTTTDQETGEIAGKEPLKTLAKFRLAKDIFPENYESFGLDKNAVLFGQNLVAENYGKMIKIGDEVEILD